MEILALVELLKTVDFAAQAHIDQRRKNRRSEPYINHPIAVAKILADAGVTDMVVLQAALLHDTIEDTSITYEIIKSVIGKEVADVVQEVTDDKSLPKFQRKLDQIKHAATASRKAQMVKLADKCHNLQTLLLDPPVDWSEDRVRKYFVWSWFVYQAIRREMNPSYAPQSVENLYYHLDRLFVQFANTSETQMSQMLAEYIEDMKKVND